MAEDVVAELELWLTARRTAENAHAFAPIGELLQRARDEILALRGYRAECERQFQAKVAEIGTLLDQVHQARDEALEEAAQVADGYCTDRTDDVASAIRALKENGDDYSRPSSAVKGLTRRVPQRQY